ncbi:hypothetical protein XELAEV_18005528mg [Xenopus laevis]|uniref:Uncharacterized protein n=1 Tax=Xenopus laevis TaxID=8355 RepID=A0A974DZG8_XENLA|nr:hypothetical protein XELAEV_18005528mg [Xenopus laevis]
MSPTLNKRKLDSEVNLQNRRQGSFSKLSVKTLYGNLVSKIKRESMRHKGLLLTCRCRLFSSLGNLSQCIANEVLL